MEAKGKFTPIELKKELKWKTQRLKNALNLLKDDGLIDLVWCLPTKDYINFVVKAITPKGIKFVEVKENVKTE